MEKKREQELSVLEVLRLHREFHLPHPVPADEQEKPLDKVKEPPRACRSREREEPLSFYWISNCKVNARLRQG